MGPEIYRCPAKLERVMPSDVNPSSTGRMRYEKEKVAYASCGPGEMLLFGFIGAVQFKCQLFIMQKNLMLANFNL